MRVGFVSVGSALLIAFSSTRAQKLQGIVVDSARRGIGGVSLTLTDASSRQIAHDLTSDSGQFTLNVSKPGPYGLRAQRIGFAPVETTVVLGDRQETIRLVLFALPTTLDTVLTKARRDVGMEEFEERRRMGIGHFYTREDIAKFDQQRTSSLLTTTSGMQVLPGAGGQAWVASSRGRQSLRGGNASVSPEDIKSGARPGLCYAAVYLDNMLVYSPGRLGGTPLFDVNSIHPASIEAIEYYSGASQIPTKFMGLNKNCGVLIIHTRR
jgi:hypothetical protein